MSDDQETPAQRLAVLRSAREALDSEIAALEKALGPRVSPLKPGAFPVLPRVAGVSVATAATGTRYRGRDDVLMVRLPEGTSIAGTFTRSATRAAPVLWCQERLADRHRTGERGPVGIMVNAGNANAFTGTNGMEATRRIAEGAGAAMGMPAGSVFIASTGVIGEPLDDGRIRDHVASMTAALATPADGETKLWCAAASAIMTTDTFPKGAGCTVILDDQPVTIAGIAKGSGMIAPDMATMLAFIMTDAAVDEALLQQITSDVVERSFNAITVDGDTSTSDTVLLAATGQAPAAAITAPADPRYATLVEAVERVFRDLALQIVRDGEGATKLVRITVTGAESDAAAKTVGLAIGNSPLVKTAIAGEDPNWGRIVMAVGKSGERADRDRLSISFGDLIVAEQGWRSPRYDEAKAAAYMQREELAIGVDLGIGSGVASVWTCDLTHGYVAINADYRS
ncbi:MAG: bifunctional glutamate N-acetyltransferase/amino-acid acetyltransferase ArgJ [Pseudomonadota bacterium]